MDNKLSIVNHLLQVVGERRVLTLETGHPSVIQASQAVDDYNLEFQGMGWWFNTNKQQDLVQDNRGEIILPKECLSFQITQYRLENLTGHEKTRYVRRGGRVYDSWKNTFNIGRPLIADLVVMIDIEDLPPIAASYLKHIAAERFYLDDDGDVQKTQMLQDRRQEAWFKLKAEQMRVQATNRLDSPAAQALTYRVHGTTYATNPMLPGGRIR